MQDNDALLRRLESLERELEHLRNFIIGTHHLDGSPVEPNPGPRPSPPPAVRLAQKRASIAHARANKPVAPGKGGVSSKAKKRELEVEAAAEQRRGSAVQSKDGTKKRPRGRSGTKAGKRRR